MLAPQSTTHLASSTRARSCVMSFQGCLATSCSSQQTNSATLHAAKPAASADLAADVPAGTVDVCMAAVPQSSHMSAQPHLPSSIITGSEVPVSASFRGMVAVCSRSAPWRLKRGCFSERSTNTTGPGSVAGVWLPSRWNTNWVPSGSPGLTWTRAMRSGVPVWHHQHMRPVTVTCLRSLHRMPQVYHRYSVQTFALPPTSTCQPSGLNNEGLHQEKLVCSLTACLAPGTAAAPGPEVSLCPSPVHQDQGCCTGQQAGSSGAQRFILTHVNGQLPLLHLCGAVWLQHPPRVRHSLHDAVVHLLQGQEEVILQASAGGGHQYLLAWHRASQLCEHSSLPGLQLKVILQPGQVAASSFRQASSLLLFQLAAAACTRSRSQE